MAAGERQYERPVFPAFKDAGSGIGKRGSPDVIPSDEAYQKKVLRIPRSFELYAAEASRWFVRCNVVKSAVGAGFRGGNWNNDATNERASDRNNAANTNTNRNNNYGARCVKTSSFFVIASEPQASEAITKAGLLRRFAPRNDNDRN